ncbi:hypothetical protein [Bacillus atrophaeus]|uniref:hypothetical protein n=1 Tax=Bacillus atrophaeus TaxID=1452 RepID=UPI00404202AB
MLRLDRNVRLRKLPEDIQRHLIADDASNEDKWAMLICIIVFLDLICAIPLLINRETIFTIIALPFIIGINLWTVIIMFTKTSKLSVFHFVLYKGGTGLVLSFCYFVLSQKYAYSVLGSNPLYIMSSLLTYIIVILGFIRYYLITLPNSDRKKKHNHAWGTYLLTIGPGAGYITAQIIFQFSDSVADLFMSYIYLLIACLISYVGVKFIHQYFFIKANQDIIDQKQ